MDNGKDGLNGIIRTMSENMPEDVRNTYETLLYKCNFHDEVDPLFPIVLFLIFFQDRFLDKQDEFGSRVKNLEEAIGKHSNDGQNGGQKSKEPGTLFTWRLCAEIFLGCLCVILLAALSFSSLKGRENEVSRGRPNEIENAEIRHLNRQLQELNSGFSPTGKPSSPAPDAVTVCLFLALLILAIVVLVFLMVLLKTLRTMKQQLVHYEESIREIGTRFSVRREMLEDMLKDGPTRAGTGHFNDTRGKVPDISEIDMAEYVTPPLSVSDVLASSSEDDENLDFGLNDMEENDEKLPKNKT